MVYVRAAFPLHDPESYGWGTTLQGRASSGEEALGLIISRGNSAKSVFEALRAEPWKS